MQRLLSHMRKAIEDFNMIEDGDKIAVALSGGKDSITMLKALKSLQYFYPKKFDLIAISINPGFEFFDSAFLKKTCDELEIPFIEEKYDINKIVFEERHEKNPCSLCANLRRGILNSVAIENGCNKVALGHHMDDVIETYMLNLFNEGRMATFTPKAYLSRKDLYLIRPLVYVQERDIKRAIARMQFNVLQNPCPNDKISARAKMKTYLADLEKINKGVKNRIFGAICRANISGFQV